MHTFAEAAALYSSRDPIDVERRVCLQFPRIMADFRAYAAAAQGGENKA